MVRKTINQILYKKWLTANITWFRERVFHKINMFYDIAMLFTINTIDN